MTDDQKLVLVGAAGIALFLILYLRTKRFLSRAVRTRGTVLEVTKDEWEQWQGEGKGSETVTTYQAKIRFSLPDGSTVEFKSPSLDHRPLGHEIEVAYDPARPHSSATVADRGVIWRYTVVVGILTGLYLIFMTCALVGSERGRALWEHPVTTAAIAIVGVGSILKSMIRRRPRGLIRPLLFVAAGVAGIYGFGALVAQRFACAGLLTSVLPSVEWPVRTAPQVAPGPNGNLIVPVAALPWYLWPLADELGSWGTALGGWLLVGVLGRKSEIARRREARAPVSEMWPS